MKKRKAALRAHKLAPGRGAAALYKVILTDPAIAKRAKRAAYLVLARSDEAAIEVLRLERPEAFLYGPTAKVHALTAQSHGLLSWSVNSAVLRQEAEADETST